MVSVWPLKVPVASSQKVEDVPVFWCGAVASLTYALSQKVTRSPQDWSTKSGATPHARRFKVSSTRS